MSNDMNRDKSQSRHKMMNLLIFSFRARKKSVLLIALTCFGAGLTLFGTTSCALLSRHQFMEPARDWEARNGQLLYRTRKTTLIGEVLVRFSKTGEFELTFSKGPGVVLLTLRQDPSFAQIKGGLARGGWSGPIANAPQRLRGWLELRDVLEKAQNQTVVRHVSGKESFVFRF